MLSLHRFGTFPPGGGDGDGDAAADGDDEEDEDGEKEAEAEAEAEAGAEAEADADAGGGDDPLVRIPSDRDRSISTPRLLFRSFPNLVIPEGWEKSMNL